MNNVSTVDDVMTTNTLDVWRDKLARESRSKREWNHRWGETFGAQARCSTPRHGTSGFMLSRPRRILACGICLSHPTTGRDPVA